MAIDRARHLLTADGLITFATGTAVQLPLEGPAPDIGPCEAGTLLAEDASEPQRQSTGDTRGKGSRPRNARWSSFAPHQIRTFPAKSQCGQLSADRTEIPHVQPSRQAAGDQIRAVRTETQRYDPLLNIRRSRVPNSVPWAGSMSRTSPQDGTRASRRPSGANAIGPGMPAVSDLATRSPGFQDPTDQSRYSGPVPIASHRPSGAKAAMEFAVSGTLSTSWPFRVSYTLAPDPCQVVHASHVPSGLRTAPA